MVRHNRFIFRFLAIAACVITMAAGCRGPETGTGKVSGIVTDDPQYLPQGAAAQTYEGASITIYKAVESGTSRVSGGSPVTKSYDVGDKVMQMTSGKGGYWQAELPAGAYFIKAFAGQQSYSGDVLFEVPEGASIKLDLKLKAGV